MKESKLQREILRVKELLKMYEDIPEGFLGASMIRQSLQNAESAETKQEIRDAIEDLQSITG